MMKEEWFQRKQKFEEQHEKWASYDIGCEGESFYLVESNKSTPFIFIERIINCVKDTLKKPLERASILDLGCMEGVVALAFAKQGAKKVVGIDVREASIARAEFAKETLGFQNVAFKKEDVRALNFDTGSFDVVLALGILYHLDVPDAFHFIENIFNWTKEITIIDTHISLVPRFSCDFKGKRYWGSYYKEPIPQSPAEVAYLYTSSMGNQQSFWFTRASLFNILVQTGYTGIYECKYPRGGGYRELDDRLTLIATKAPHQNSPLFYSKDVERIENFEEREYGDILVHPANLGTDLPATRG